MTSSFPMTRGAKVAAAVSAAVPMPMINRGAYAFTAAPGSYAFRDKIDIDGFDHPRKVFDLTGELIRRGYSNENITAVLGGKFRRLLAQVWG